MKLYTTPLIGMLCSALVIGNSYAAGTFVASKSYVDNYVDNAVSPKQDKLGGGTNNGKVVTATSTAGDVTYTEIDSTPTAGSTKLITSGGVQAAISDATSSQLKTSDEDSTNVVTSANTGKIPTVSGVQAGIAKQGSATVDWTAVTDSTSGASDQLKDAKTNQDNYVPTVKAVETRIKTTETSLSANINAKEDQTNKVTSIGSSNTDTQYPSAKAVYAVTSTLNTVKQNKNDSKVEGTKGTDFHYITAGNNVGANLIALDNQVKTNADSISANTANINERTVTDNKDGTYNITDGDTSIDVYSTKDLYNKTTADGKFEVLANKIDSKATWQSVATSATRDTSYPTVAAVEARVHTAELAADAKVEDQIVDNVTNKAPSQNAVYDALANKADKATTLAAYGITDAYTKSDVYTKSETNTELAKKEDNTNKATTEDNWEQIANDTDQKDTKYPTVAAVQEYASSTYLTQNLANVPNGNYGNINPGTGVAGNLVALDAAVSNIANNAAVKNAGLPVSPSTKNSVVTYDDQGLVTGGFELENGGIKSIENADSATLCSTTNPCILTYLGGTGAAADYRWTPMDEGSETIPAKPAS